MSYDYDLHSGFPRIDSIFTLFYLSSISPFNPFRMIDHWVYGQYGVLVEEV